ncbi:unnamed protein product [Effrenium voratum]|nr:unnamed protein product [Effrenium voratum]
MPEMLEKRSGCAASALPGGTLLVVGGYDERGIVSGLLDTCEIFDPATQEWRLSEARLQRPRWGHGCAYLAGKVFCAGGCSRRDGSPAHEVYMETLRTCEVYDPSRDRWDPFPDLKIARAGARVVVIGDQHLAVVGGCDDVFGRAELLNSVELLDIHAGTWVLLNPLLRAPRTTAAVAALDDRSILVMGGAPSLATAELFTVFSKPARQGEDDHQVCTLSEGRMGCQAACLRLPSEGKTFPICDRQCVVVVGGENGDDDNDNPSRQFSSVLVYDVAAGRWLKEGSFPELPTTRTAMALCVGPGLIHGHAQF